MFCTAIKIKRDYHNEPICICMYNVVHIVQDAPIKYVYNSALTGTGIYLSKKALITN